MAIERTFDVVVIGAGPGGYHAAIRAAQLGLSVAVVEKDDGSGIGGLGGVCLNWGCIPSKSLLKNAELVNEISRSKEWGFSFSNFKADVGRAIDRSREVSDRLTKGIDYLLRKNKVDVFKGTAVLTSNSSVAVEGVGTINANQIVVATGARARNLPNIRIDGDRIISYREALEMRELPENIAIIGASAIGCEFAYYFNAYGAKVQLFEVADRLVPKEDKDISTELARQFKKQGIKAITGAKIASVDIEESQVVIRYSDKGGDHASAFGKILLGVGVVPNTEDIGLEDLGVELTQQGNIVVDGNMRTSVAGIYAVGDVTGKLPLAHVAFEQGIVAAETIAEQNPQPLVDYSLIPRCTYCHPEIASIGLTEDEARDEGLEVNISKAPYAAAGKSIAIGASSGFVKLITDKASGEVVGTHIIGENATELIAEVGMLSYLEGTNVEMARVVRAHPTLSEVLGEAAAAIDNEAIHL